MMTKQDVVFVCNKLYEDKRISSLSRLDGLPFIILKIMKEMKKPSVKKIKGSEYAFRKTKEWDEVVEITRQLFNRMVDNSSGCFLDKEFERNKKTKLKKIKGD
jgi:hypothetical protein